MSAEISIGNEIKDGYKETYKWVYNNIKWLGELETFYRERAKLEREYSEKLSHLTGEYFAKKSSATVALSVGDTPTITPGSLEAASLVTWNEVLSQTEMISKDHNTLSQEFEFQIADQIVALSRKCDLLMTSINGFNTELTERKDQAFGNLEKAKKHYDETCIHMESARAKQSKSSSDRTQRRVDEKEHDMNIAKNSYLIKINQANRLKDKYYFQDVPEVLDLLQDLNESKTRLLNILLRSAGTLERQLHKKIDSRLDTIDSVVAQNKPHLDTSMFIKHNVKSWKEPGDFTYIPSSVWHDDKQFVVSNVELQDLKVKLVKAQQLYDQMNSTTQNEASSLSSLNKQKQQLKSDENADAKLLLDILTKYSNVVSSFTSHETSKLEAEVEIESIQNNVSAEHDLSTDDVDLSKLEKKGGFLNKFRRNLTISSSDGGSTRHDTHDSASILSSESKHRSLGKLSIFKKRDRAQSNVSALSNNASHDALSDTSSLEHSGNRVLYPYQMQDSDEVDVNPGDTITLVASDPGNGWTKIKNETTGKTGMVPSTYVDMKEKPRSAAPRAPPPRKSPGTSHTIEVLYDYTAQGDDEISISEGDIINVIKADDGSGWTFGELQGKKGLFPTSYCK